MAWGKLISLSLFTLFVRLPLVSYRTLTGIRIPLKGSKMLWHLWKGEVKHDISEAWEKRGDRSGVRAKRIKELQDRGGGRNEEREERGIKREWGKRKGERGYVQ